MSITGPSNDPGANGARDTGWNTGSDARFPLLSFRDDVYIESDPREPSIVFHSRWADIVLPRPAAQVSEALRRMTLGPVSLYNAIGNGPELAELGTVLDRLDHLVVHSLGTVPGQPLISVIPMTERARFQLPRALPPRPSRLSRLAMIRTDGSNYSIESPLSLHRVTLHGSEALAELGPLFRAVRPSAAQQRQHSMISYLTTAGMIVQAASASPHGKAEFAEDTDPALAPWAPIDLMFHTRSTLGRHDYDFGATYPLGDEGGVEPVVKPSLGQGWIALPRPTWDQRRAEPSLSAVLEGRYTAREYGTQPLTAAELGELLYRAARVRSLSGSADPSSTAATSDRPYPSAGDCYELEVYPVLDRCVGIARGAYHYDPYRHGLEEIETHPSGVDELLEMGRVMAGLRAIPPAQFIVTARFRRISWKYDKISYALALRDVGALIQSLALVGTMIGLAVGELDSADIDTSARVLRLDWRTESSIGGLAVGHHASRRHSRSSAHYPVNDHGWAACARTLLL